MIKTGILCVLLVIFGIGIWLWPEEQKKSSRKHGKKRIRKQQEVDGSVSSDSTGKC